jgi:hypothetical protein
MVLIGGITANCYEQFHQYHQRDKHEKRKGGENDNIPHSLHILSTCVGYSRARVEAQMPMCRDENLAPRKGKCTNSRENRDVEGGHVEQEGRRFI